MFRSVRQGGCVTPASSLGHECQLCAGGGDNGGRLAKGASNPNLLHGDPGSCLYTGLGAAEERRNEARGQLQPEELHLFYNPSKVL